MEWRLPKKRAQLLLWNLWVQFEEFPRNLEVPQFSFDFILDLTIKRSFQEFLEVVRLSYPQSATFTQTLGCCLNRVAQ